MYVGLNALEIIAFLEIMDGYGRRPCYQIGQIALGACISAVAP